MTNILKAAQLTKTFGNVKALDHCDLEIRKGEIYDQKGSPGSRPSGFCKKESGKALKGDETESRLCKDDHPQPVPSVS